MNCGKCVFSEVLAKKGESYAYRDPIGNEILNTRESSIIICRESPPMNGWPQVQEDDWCGKFNSGEEVSE